MMVLFGFVFLILGMVQFVVNIQERPGAAWLWAFLAMIGAGLLYAV